MARRTFYTVLKQAKSLVIPLFLAMSKPLQSNSGQEKFEVNTRDKCNGVQSHAINEKPLAIVFNT